MSSVCVGGYIEVVSGWLDVEGGGGGIACSDLGTSTYEKRKKKKHQYLL